MGVVKQRGKGRVRSADAGCAPQKGHTPMYAAAYQGKVAVVQVLLDAGADKEATDEVKARG